MYNPMLCWTNISIIHVCVFVRFIGSRSKHEMPGRLSEGRIITPAYIIQVALAFWQHKYLCFPCWQMCVLTWWHFVDLTRNNSGCICVFICLSFCVGVISFVVFQIYVSVEFATFTMYVIRYRDAKCIQKLMKNMVSYRRLVNLRVQHIY